LKNKNHPRRRDGHVKVSTEIRAQGTVSKPTRRFLRLRLIQIEGEEEEEKDEITWKFSN
jgi:hypothetical protein